MEGAREVRRRNLLLVLGGVVILAAFFSMFYIRIRMDQTMFEQDGYMYEGYEGVVGEAGQMTYRTVLFSAGTTYTGKYPEKAVFTDIEGRKQALDMDRFVYYTDGSVGSFIGGVVADLNSYTANKVIQSYYIPERAMLGMNGSDYIISQNGQALEFQDLIWKEDEKHYLALSPELILVFADGSQEKVGGKLEIRYLEQGVVQLITGDKAWQIIASGNYVNFADGYYLELGSGDIKTLDDKSVLNLADMDEDMTDLIRVKNKDAWSPPSYHFNIINGKDGEDGEDGDKGRDGETGQTGQAGESGQAGSAGEAGGAGGVGAAGQKGASVVSFSKETDTYYPASAILKSIETTGTELTGLFTIDPKDMIFTELKLQVLDSQGNVVQDSTVLELFEGGYIYLSENELDDELIDLEYHFENLTEDTQYTLRLSGEYTFDSDQGGGNYVIFTRDFFTSSLGVSVNLNYVTEDSIYMSALRAADSEVKNITLELYEADGTTQVTLETANLKTGDNEIVLGQGSLSSDTEYIVKASANGKSLGSYSFRTLKKTPTVGTLAVSNKLGRLNMQVTDVSDEDRAILEYTYEIYDINETLIKSITTTSTENIEVAIDEEEFFYNMEYKVRALVRYQDNEKQVEFRTDMSEGVIVVRTNEITITYASDDTSGAIGSNELLGRFTIDPGQIEISYTSTMPIHVEIMANTEPYKEAQTIVYSKGDAICAIENNGTFILPLVMTDDQSNPSVYRMPGVRPETTYQFNFYGIYFDPNSLLEDPYAEPAYGLLGTYTITTGKE